MVGSGTGVFIERWDGVMRRSTTQRPHPGGSIRPSVRRVDGPGWDEPATAEDVADQGSLDKLWEGSLEVGDKELGG